MNWLENERVQDVLGDYEIITTPDAIHKIPKSKLIKTFQIVAEEAVKEHEKEQAVIKKERLERIWKDFRDSHNGSVTLKSDGGNCGNVGNVDNLEVEK